MSAVIGLCMGIITVPSLPSHLLGQGGQGCCGQEAADDLEEGGEGYKPTIGPVRGGRVSRGRGRSAPTLDR